MASASAEQQAAEVALDAGALACAAHLLASAHIARVAAAVLDDAAAPAAGTTRH